jgi:putative transposase
VIVDYIDEHRDEFGVEPICRGAADGSEHLLRRKKRQLAPSARAVRDAVMMQVLMVLWVTNRKVYGAHKLWKAARRAGHDIGRDQVARLMHRLDIEGVSAGNAARCSPPARTPTPCGHRIWSTGTSPPPARTSCG